MSETSSSKPDDKESFLWLATRPSVVRRAAKIALIVGVVLAMINHGDKILSGTLGAGGVFKILLTFLVPYSVSSYSSVLAIRERTQLVESDRGT
ncbi:nitrate/nitrite transporter NrtS [Microbulbifer sp. S227A]|uniref:nitrate/nitrite transporter NrtS n=1 Tax=Microbulbifer sp. S227A TaxID=3415131 RepID=UPI003C7D1CC8